MFFVSISFGVGYPTQTHFQWNMGLTVMIMIHMNSNHMALRNRGIWGGGERGRGRVGRGI